jgi:hypothetical protein
MLARMGWGFFWGEGEGRGALGAAIAGDRVLVNIVRARTRS